MAEPTTARRAEGITLRHRQGCTAPQAPCRCSPAYQAQVFSPRDRRTIRKSFKSLAALEFQSEKVFGTVSAEGQVDLTI
jgi:hypothetical protein